MTTIRRVAMTMTVAAMVLGAMAPAVLANGATDQARAESAG